MPTPGITPACAGKSSALWQCRMSRRDHPRVCGEKDASIPQTNNHRGSPPRMRGKVCSMRIFPGFTRITPAYAGKSK